jgi:hypothetical protein
MGGLVAGGLIRRSHGSRSGRISPFTYGLVDLFPQSARLSLIELNFGLLSPPLKDPAFNNLKMVRNNRDRTVRRASDGAEGPSNRTEGPLSGDALCTPKSKKRPLESFYCSRVRPWAAPLTRNEAMTICRMRPKHSRQRWHRKPHRRTLRRRRLSTTSHTKSESGPAMWTLGNGCRHSMPKTKWFSGCMKKSSQQCRCRH